MSKACSPFRGWFCNLTIYSCDNVRILTCRLQKSDKIHQIACCQLPYIFCLKAIMRISYLYSVQLFKIHTVETAKMQNLVFTVYVPLHTCLPRHKLITSGLLLGSSTWY